MSALLQVRQLSRHYGERIGCEAVSFDLHPGELLCIVGESGSGKSTLLNTVAAQLAPTGGSVRYRQRDGGWRVHHARVRADQRGGVLSQPGQARMLSRTDPKRRGVQARQNSWDAFCQHRLSGTRRP